MTGLSSGDRFTVAWIWGALNCRAGFVAEGPDDLPKEIDDYVDRLVAPYFEAVAEWYGALHVGQKGGALQEIIDRQLGDPFFGIFLNPGHQIHLDEWVNSPVGPGSDIELASGMALQVDIIPATGTNTSPPTSRTASRWPTRRCARNWPIAIRTRGNASLPDVSS